MKGKGITQDIKQDVKRIIDDFNQKTFGTDDCYYQARFRGKYLYLDRWDFGRMGSICRLTYIGHMDRWEFAIFKWSNEKYSADEWLFPGCEYFDGTIEGAMIAGLEAYPP